MAPARPLVLAVTVLAASALLAACSSSSSDAPASSAPAASPAATVAASPAATGVPSPELVTWAGQVCDDTTALRDSVTGIASAVATGGTDIGASLQSQFTTISSSAGQLVATVQLIPQDQSGPEAAEVKQSADDAKASIEALGKSITDLANASGVGVATALPAVVSAAGDAVNALGDTAGAIQSALQGGQSTLSQAFAANPSCTALQQ